MSLVCNECGKQVSSDFNFCPYCGFKITNQEVIKFNIIDQNDNNIIECPSINISYNNKLVNLFTDNFDNLKKVVPELAVLIEKVFQSKNILTAEIPNFIKNQIKDGTLSLVYDHSGNLLPIIRDTSTNKIVQQFRLKETLLTPDLASTLLNIQLYALAHEILSGIKDLREDIANIKEDLQNDRYALASSAFTLLKKANMMDKENLKNDLLIQAISTATIANKQLMNSFELEYKNLYNNSKHQEVYAEAVIKNLHYILYSKMVECEAYSQLNQQQPLVSSIKEFKYFLNKYNLLDRDTLVDINCYLDEDYSNVTNSLHAKFVQITNKLIPLEDNTNQLSSLKIEQNK